MNNIRNFVVLFSVVLGAVGLNAEEALHGKFQLNSQVRWGKAVLSAGEYSFVINDMNVPIKMTIHSLNGKTDALEVARSSAGAAPGGSYIFVTGSGDNKRVCSMNLPQLGRSLIYEPLTKGERETLYASKSHTVPAFGSIDSEIRMLHFSRRLMRNLDYTQYQKAPTFRVSCESSEHHPYRKGAPL